MPEIYQETRIIINVVDGEIESVQNLPFHTVIEVRDYDVRDITDNPELKDDHSVIFMDENEDEHVRIEYRSIKDCGKYVVARDIVRRT